MTIPVITGKKNIPMGAIQNRILAVMRASPDDWYNVRDMAYFVHVPKMFKNADGAMIYTADRIPQDHEMPRSKRVIIRRAVKRLEDLGHVEIDAKKRFRLRR